MTKIDRTTGAINTVGLRNYPKDAIDAAKEGGYAYIDLNALSVEVWTALGPQLDVRGTVDGLHSNTYGGYLLSRCIVEGDDFFHDGMQIQYAKLFPNDVNFIIGKSDFRKDWYYQQPPHATDEAIAAAAAPRPARLPGETPLAGSTPAAARGAPGAPGAAGAPPGARGGAAPAGRATPWTITFDMPNTVKGKATLRAAFSGTGTRFIDVAVNGESAGQLGPLQMDSTLGTLGNGIQGIWHENEFVFDASKLKTGTNTLTLTVPAGALTAGVIYDYLRLELDESAPPPAAQ